MHGREAGDTDAVVVSEAYAAARELLQQAESDAERIRSDAERYRRQREQEVELLVAKARRLLTMAEERAIAITTAAAVPAPDPVRIVLDVDAPDPGWEIDPDASPARNGAPTGSGRSELDSIVATSVSRAIHRALATDG